MTSPFQVVFEQGEQMTECDCIYLYVGGHEYIIVPNRFDEPDGICVRSKAELPLRMYHNGADEVVIEHASVYQDSATERN